MRGLIAGRPYGKHGVVGLHRTLLAALILTIYGPMDGSVFAEDGQANSSSRSNGTADRSTREDAPYFTIESILDKYSGHSTRPGEQSGEADVVTCSLRDIRIDDVDQVNLEFTMTLTLELLWNDSRLQGLLPNNSETFYSVRGASIDRIWLPDLYFPLLKSGEYHEVTSLNRILRIHRTQLIYYASRLTLTQSCNMEFVFFPFDSQKCDTKISTSYSGLNATISMTRTSVFYVITYMSSLLLLAMLSLLNYWLDPEQTPARVSLGITTVLAAITQISNALRGLPQLPYLTALDVWMHFCLNVTIFSLAEYALVHIFVFSANKQELAMERRNAKPNVKPKVPPNERLIKQSEPYFFYHHERDSEPLGFIHHSNRATATATATAESAEEMRIQTVIRRHRSWARLIDTRMRVIMPVVLVVFVGIYAYVYYLHRLHEFQ